MEREKLSITELSIDELTTQVMQLLRINLPELYAVLGFQLIGYSRPARVAGIMSYHTTLQRIVDGQSLYNSVGVCYPMAELSKGIDVIYEELKQDGARFLETVREQLHTVLCTPEILELAERATASRIEIMVLMISGALRMPAEMQSLAATIAAVIYKSGLKEFCEEYSTRKAPVQAAKDKVSG